MEFQVILKLQFSSLIKDIQRSITSLYTVDTVSIAVDSGNWESQKDHLKVRGHILPDSRTVTPPPHSLQFTSTIYSSPHLPTCWIESTCSLQCYSMIYTVQVASMDSTAVITVHVCGHLAYVGTVYNSEDTCRTMSLCVRVSSDDYYVQYHSK